MKKLLSFLILILVLGITSCATTEQNTRKDLNWAGLYTGTTPGANSDIYTEIILNKDSTFKISYNYIGKSDENFTRAGKFVWKDADTIDLKIFGVPSLFVVGENTLTQLDNDGNKIEGKLAHMFVLKKK